VRKVQQAGVTSERYELGGWEWGESTHNAANLLTRDEVRRIAIKMNKLPELLRRPQY
jgi:hypothetical protein